MTDDGPRSTPLTSERSVDGPTAFPSYRITGTPPGMNVTIEVPDPRYRKANAERVLLARPVRGVMASLYQSPA
jgi:hypothetical protein